MPLQNRVLPTGEIVAAPFRGCFTGNRGILQFDGAGRLGPSRWKHKHWIICTLTHPRGRYHGPQPARGWTPLFFTDEAVGLTAGHRPCAYCRPDAYRAWKAAWATAHGAADHKAMDDVLHRARVTRRREQVRHQAKLGDLPEGAFCMLGEGPHLVSAQALFPYADGKYSRAQDRQTRNAEQVLVLTPRPTLAVLRVGYTPENQSVRHLP